MFERRIRSYVLREGRMTAGQHRALEEQWPRYGLSVEAGRVDFAACFGRTAPVVMEIGFGMGDSLAEMATLSPDTDFIGVEVHRPGVGHLLNLAAGAGLDNLRVFNADSFDVLSECINPGSVDRVQIFFPDPWHKKRHHKRRLVNPEFVRLVEGRLKPGGVLHVATDWPPYAEYIVEVLAGAGSLTTTPPPRRPVTKYERRGIRLGHEVADLAWRKSG